MFISASANRKIIWCIKKFRRLHIHDFKTENENQVFLVNDWLNCHKKYCGSDKLSTSNNNLALITGNYNYHLRLKIGKSPKEWFMNGPWLSLTCVFWFAYNKEKVGFNWYRMFEIEEWIIDILHLYNKSMCSNTRVFYLAT